MNKKGFTLVELIVVIVIIAILAAIAIPAMMRYIDNANAATAEANVRTIVSAAVAAHAADIAFRHTFNEEVMRLLGHLDGSTYTADGNNTFGGGTFTIERTAENGITEIVWRGRGHRATWDGVDIEVVKGN
jgi:prepilin-type N-terminal cleavage/methylation domain-containing protein